jgi:hypothetical protein
VSVDAVAVFEVSSKNLRDELLKRFAGAKETVLGIVVWIVPRSYPGGEDHAQAREIGGLLLDGLGELYEEVVGSRPGVWIEPYVDGTLPTSIPLVADKGSGRFVTRDGAGSQMQRQADSMLQIHALLRVAKALEGKKPTSLEDSVAAVLEAFSEEERAALDSAARRDGAGTFAKQIAQLLKSARG